MLKKSRCIPPGSAKQTEEAMPFDCVFPEGKERRALARGTFRVYI